MANRSSLTATFGYYLFYVAAGLILSSLGPSLPTIAEQTGSLLGSLGILFTALSIGRMIGALGLGRAFDHVPGHPLMAGLLALMSLLLFLVPFAGSLWLLVGAFFLAGIAWGALDVAANTLLVWAWGDRSGPFLNGLHLFFGLGAVVAPLAITASLHSVRGIRAAYWSFAALLLVNAVWVLFQRSPAMRNSSQKHAATGFDWPFVIGVVVLISLCVGVEITFGGWVYSYLLDKRLALPEQAALLNSLYWAALSVGRLLAIWLSTRFRPQVLLSLDLIGCFVAAATIAIWPASVRAIWVGTLLLGFSMASIFPMTIVYTERRVPITSLVTGLIILGDGIGSMTFPWLAGRLLESAGSTAIAWQLVATTLVALVVFAWQNRPSKRTIAQASTAE